MQCLTYTSTETRTVQCVSLDDDDDDDNDGDDDDDNDDDGDSGAGAVFLLKITTIEGREFSTIQQLLRRGDAISDGERRCHVGDVVRPA